MIVHFRRTFIKDMKSITDPNLLTRLENAIFSLEKADSLSELTGLKKLKSSRSDWSIRVGDYRIGAELIDNEIHLLRFLHRKEIYRYFP